MSEIKEEKTESASAVSKGLDTPKPSSALDSTKLDPLVKSLIGDPETVVYAGRSGGALTISAQGRGAALGLTKLWRHDLRVFFPYMSAIKLIGFLVDDVQLLQQLVDADVTVCLSGCVLWPEIRKEVESLAKHAGDKYVATNMIIR